MRTSADGMRVFVGIEIAILSTSILLAAAGCITGLVRQNFTPWAIASAVIMLAGIGVVGFLMATRVITYIIGFAQMIELLDATRILLLSLFRKPGTPAPQPFRSGGQNT